MHTNLFNRDNNYLYNTANTIKNAIFEKRMRWCRITNKKI